MTPRHALARVLFALIATALSVPVQAQEIPGHIWVPPYSAKQERDRIKSGALPTTQMQRAGGKPPKTILDTRGTETRLETELQSTVEIPDVPEIEKMLDAFTRDKKLTAETFGKGYEMVRVEKEPRKMADPYFDSKGFDLALSGGSLRIRIMNGIAVVNFKPPTAVRFKNGVAHRIEAGVPVTLDKEGRLSEATIKFLLNPRLLDNPLREWKKFYPNVDLRQVLTSRPVVEIKQKRAIYEVMKDGTKVNELSADMVYATLVKTQSEKSFGSLEGEGDHLNLVPTKQQLAHAASRSWKGPHRGTDTWNEALAGSAANRPADQIGKDASPDVAQVHMVADTLLRLAGGKARPAGLNKYVRALIAHGVFTEEHVVARQTAYREALVKRLGGARAPRPRRR
jgi:hypothetical protein